MDIPGASLTSDMENSVHMMLCVRLSEQMAQLNPSINRKYVIAEIGINVLYVQLQKAMYKTLLSDLIFYQKLLKDIKSQGFELNPYDP